MSALVPFADALDAALDMAGIRHFSALEVCQVGRVHKGVALKAVPVELWPRIVPTLMVLEEIRGDDPLAIHSGYRDPAYNRAVGGASASQHTRFTAIDFSSRTRTPIQLARTLDAHPLRETLGIGVYPTFVHVDTRGRAVRFGNWNPLRPAA